MSSQMTRSDLQRTSPDAATDHTHTCLSPETLKRFQGMCDISKTVEGIVSNISTNLDGATVDNALKAGMLTCSCDLFQRASLKVQAVDLDNLLTPNTAETSVLNRVESQMKDLVHSSVNELGEDETDAFFQAVQLAAPEDAPLLCTDMINDILYFVTVKHHSSTP